MNVFRKEYALYKGDEVIAIGTIKEISDKVNVKIGTLRGYGKRGYVERLEKRVNHNCRILITI